MYSLWKEVSDQLKKKAEDLNSNIQEFNINGLGKDSRKESTDNINNEQGNDKGLHNVIFNSSINDKLNLINKTILNKDLSELKYYNDKFKSGINNIKKIVGDLYNENIKNINGVDGNKKKIYLSKIVPWKKADILISKIYRKKFNEGIPLKIPNSHLNKEVYEKILELNVNKNRILHTDILENYNFVWSKKKEQSEQIIEEDPNLLKTKNFLVPSYMSELDFWKSYFFNVDIIYNEIADEIYENREYIAECYQLDQLENKKNINDNSHDPNKNQHHDIINFENKNPMENRMMFMENDSQNLKENCQTVINKSNGFDNFNFTEKREHLENNILFKDAQKETDNSLYVEQQEHLLTFEFDDNITSVDHPNKVDFSKMNVEKEKPIKGITEKNEVTLPNENTFFSTLTNNDETKHEEATSTMHVEKINGLSIYMDNDIYLNLTEKTSNLADLLNNSKGKDQEGTLSSENVIEELNAFNEHKQNNEEPVYNNKTNEQLSFKNFHVDQLNFSKPKTDLFEENCHLLKEVEDSNTTYLIDEKKKNEALLEFNACVAEKETKGDMVDVHVKRDEINGINKNIMFQQSNIHNDNDTILMGNMGKKEEKEEHEINFKKEEEEEEKKRTLFNINGSYGSREQNIKNHPDDCNINLNIPNGKNEVNTISKKSIEINKQNEFTYHQNKSSTNQVSAQKDIFFSNESKGNDGMTNFENINWVRNNDVMNSDINKYQNDITNGEIKYDENKKTGKQEIENYKGNGFMNIENSMVETEKVNVGILDAARVSEDTNINDDKNKTKEKKKEDEDLFNFNDEMKLEELNFGDDRDFDIDTNNFNEEELIQFESFILNT